MRTLLLIAPNSRNERTKLLSDRDVKIAGSSLVGRVLGRRYKILETGTVDSFKAHDFVLDQIVTVRQALLPSQSDGEMWRQKVRQLAVVRDPSFLNVLKVISDKSREFVITERPQGHPIADFLRGRSRLDLQDVLRLGTPLASALDLAASFSCCPNLVVSCWLFTGMRNLFEARAEERSLSDWPRFLLKLDVWELVRPRKNNMRPVFSSKAQRGRLAVRQMALLTYELLGGEIKEEGSVKRWFKPLNGLGDAGNSILFRGLQGSSLFESSGCFFQKLKSAIQAGDGESGALLASTLAPQNSVFLPAATNDVIKRFNRDTRWLATAVLGVVFAGLMLALSVQERYPEAVHHTEKAWQGGRDLLLNANSTPAKNGIVNGKSSTGEIATREARNTDQAFEEISPQEYPSAQMQAAASTPTPLLSFTPELDRHPIPANTNPWISGHRQAAGQTRLEVPRTRSKSSYVKPRFVDVKMRLIELWHQSLAHRDNFRSWTPFSNLKKEDRKKISYTAQTNH